MKVLFLTSAQFVLKLVPPLSCMLFIIAFFVSASAPLNNFLKKSSGLASSSSSSSPSLSQSFGPLREDVGYAGVVVFVVVTLRLSISSGIADGFVSELSVGASGSAGFAPAVHSR